MNLSHYQSLDPDVDRSDGQKPREACCKPLPADDQAAVLFLKPGQRPLHLEAGDPHLDGTAPRSLGLPDSLRNLCPDIAFARMQAQRFGVIALIGRQHLGTFARAPRLASAQADRIQQRQHLGALSPIRRRGVVRQGHVGRVGETMEQNPLVFAATGHALTAACARGNRSRPRPHTAIGSCRVPRRVRAHALAGRPMSHRPASAAATDARRS